MAPRKVVNKKKKAVATSKANKTAAKTKTKKQLATVLTPLEKKLAKVDVSTIAILGERRENTVQITKNESHDYDLVKQIPKLLKEHPEYNICIVGGSPEVSVDAQSRKPYLLVILVPNKKNDDPSNKSPQLPPPFVAYSVKEELIISDLSKHQLSWQIVVPRVYILKSGKRLTKAAIKAMSDDSLAMEEHLQLWTIVPSDKLQRNQAGKLDVRHVTFDVMSTKGEAIPGDYEKGAGLQDYIDTFVDDYGDELGDNPHEKVKDAIKQAFDDARTKLEEQAEMLYDAGYNNEVLDGIQTIKIYPKGIVDSEKSSYINKYYVKAHKVL